MVEELHGLIFWQPHIQGVLNDSLAGNDGDLLREFEEMSFAQIFKDEVEAELGSWTGSDQQNRLADYKIAGSVKNPFKNYEKTNPPSLPLPKCTARRRGFIYFQI